jgi:CBS domain containing-hemolysin-like protein
MPWSVLLVALATIGFAIAAETGLIGASRSAIRKLGEEGNGRAKLAEQLQRNSAQVMTTTMLLKSAAVLVAGAAMARLLPDTLALSQIVLVIAAAWLILVLLLTAARSWVQARATRALLALAPLLRMAVWLLSPVAALLHQVDRSGNQNEDEPLDEALRSVGIDDDDEPMLESEKQMITSILEMDETVAREVMVPRIDMVAINVETSLRDALGVIINAGHSRIPVFEQHIDHVVGLLYAKDLLKWFQDNPGDVPIRTLLRPAYFVPASKKVDILLREMQRDRIHIAVVVDEYGGTAGLVTIEDIIEEIVGDIQDEYDAEEELYVQSFGVDGYLLNARFDLYSLSKLLDAELPADDADTLGGMIYSVLGHVPDQGESIDVGGWRFTVLGLEGRRIEQVRAEPLGQSVVDEAQPEDAERTATPGANPIYKLSASD